MYHKLKKKKKNIVFILRVTYFVFVFSVYMIFRYSSLQLILSITGNLQKHTLTIKLVRVQCAGKLRVKNNFTLDLIWYLYLLDGPPRS